MANILIVEDEPAIARLIRMNLSLVGLEASWMKNGSDALNLIEDEKFDLVILDLMLPDISGEDVLKRLVKKDIPVIVVSAKSNIMDRVACLRMGAQDYVTKPFDNMELVTRIEVILRVHNKLNKINGKMEYADIVVDLDKHIVTKNNEEIELTPKEYDLLVYLVKYVGVALSREEIFKEIWGFKDLDGNRTIDIHIQRLRKKLGIQSQLKTIYKVGYILERI